MELWKELSRQAGVSQVRALETSFAARMASRSRVRTDFASLSSLVKEANSPAMCTPNPDTATGWAASPSCAKHSRASAVCVPWALSGRTTCVSCRP